MSDPFEQQRMSDEAMRRSQDQQRLLEENARREQLSTESARRAQAAAWAREQSRGRSAGAKVVGLVLFVVAAGVLAIIFLQFL